MCLRSGVQKAITWPTTSADAIAVCTAILDKGVDVNEELENGMFAIHNCVFRATQKGDASASLVRFLLERGAAIDAREREQRRTPLQVAAAWYASPTTEGSNTRRLLVLLSATLVQCGASTQGLDDEGGEHAAFMRCVRTSINEEEARTVLDDTLFTRRDFPRYKAWVLDKERAGEVINIDAADGRGRTALQWAISYADEASVVSAVKFLLNRGASATAAQEHGHHALHVFVFRAWQRGSSNRQLFNVLREAGADVDARSLQNAKTPLALAAELHDREQHQQHRAHCVRVGTFLVAAGANKALCTSKSFLELVRNATWSTLGIAMVGSVLVVVAAFFMGLAVGLR